MADLRTPAEAMARLKCKPKQLRAYVKAGLLRYVQTGLSTKRPRRAYTDADIDAFIERRTRMETPSCQSTSRKARRSINMTSGAEIVAIADRLSARAAGMPKQ